MEYQIENADCGLFLLLVYSKARLIPRQGRVGPRLMGMDSQIFIMLFRPP
jgi:hypothetical protein